MAQSLRISGRVIDSLQQKPLTGATIVLFDSTGRELTSLATNGAGDFSLASASSEVRTVAISYAGFKAKTLAISYDRLLKDYKLGTLYLYPDGSSLREIVVTGKRPPVSFKVDRQVYKPGQFGNATGGTGVDLLRNLPAVTVNGQGDIAFRGSSSFLVLINGKPTQGDPSFVLGQLAAGSVESIEVITSPSAAYDAEGKSGIINIITKTGVEDGWVVQANTMGGLPPFNDFNNRHHVSRYSADISIGYRRGRWDLSGGANLLRNDMAGYREGEVFTKVNNQQTFFPSAGERSFRRYNYGGRLAASFQAGKRSSLHAGFYRGKKYQRRVADLLYQNRRINQATGAEQQFAYFNENTQEKEGIFTLANLDFTHDFNKGAKLTLSALYERADLWGNTFNKNLAYPSLRDTFQYTLNPYKNPLDAYRIKADYAQRVGPGTLQAGYQYRYDVQAGDFRYLTRLQGRPDFELNPAFSSNVAASNHIHGAYLQYGAAAGKLQYNGGLRVEQSTRSLRLAKGETPRQLALTNFFPSVQLRYGAWNKGVLKAGYSRRIKRTNNYELNPFPEREHSETLEQGDPELLPELIGNLEAGVEQGFAGGNLYVSLYYQRVKNPIQRVNSVFNDTILNRLYTNAGLARQVGLETNLSLQLTKNWNAVLGGNMYHYDIAGALFNNTMAVQNNSWVYSINSTQTFSLPRSWSAQLSINYLSARVTAQGEDSRFLTPHFSVKKGSKDKRWNYQLQWLNIDGGLKLSNRQRITTYGNNFYTTTNYIYEPDQVQFSVSFNLARKNRKINLPVSEMGEKEF